MRFMAQDLPGRVVGDAAAAAAPPGGPGQPVAAGFVAEATLAITDEESCELRVEVVHGPSVGDRAGPRQ